jgi:hypothetical protein
MVAAAIIGSAVVGGVASGIGSSRAASAQEAASNRATDTQLQMFNTLNQQQQPFREAGYSALGSILQGFGLTPPATDASGNPLSRGNAPGTQSAGIDSGFFSHAFNAGDLNANLAPNYDFSLKQGLGAVTNFANVTGGLSGNTLKAINDYAQNYAQGAYQQAYTNFNNNQTNIFNRLASIAGLGQTAGSNSATGASTFAGNIGSSITGYGNAQAAGAVGTANAVSNAAGGISNYYLLSSLMNGPGSGPG